MAIKPVPNEQRRIVSIGALIEKFRSLLLGISLTPYEAKLLRDNINKYISAATEPGGATIDNTSI